MLKNVKKKQVKKYLTGKDWPDLPISILLFSYNSIEELFIGA
jgi:hypothetical protein